MASLATSGRLTNGIDYCVKVSKQVKLAQCPITRPQYDWRKFTTNDTGPTEYLQRFSRWVVQGSRRAHQLLGFLLVNAKNVVCVFCVRWLGVICITSRSMPSVRQIVSQTVSFDPAFHTTYSSPLAAGAVWQIFPYHLAYQCKFVRLYDGWYVMCAAVRRIYHAVVRSLRIRLVDVMTLIAFYIF